MNQPSGTINDSTSRNHVSDAQNITTYMAAGEDSCVRRLWRLRWLCLSSKQQCHRTSTLTQENLQLSLGKCRCFWILGNCIVKAKYWRLQVVWLCTDNLRMQVLNSTNYFNKSEDLDAGNWHLLGFDQELNQHAKRIQGRGWNRDSWRSHL